MKIEDHSAAPVLRLSADVLPPGSRVHAVREYLTELMQADLHLVDTETPLNYRGELKVVSDVQFGPAFSSALKLTRTAAHLHDGSDDLMLVMPDVPMRIDTHGIEALCIAPGEALLLSQARAMQSLHARDGSVWMLRVPHRELAERVPQLPSSPILALRSGTPLLSLVRRYGNLLGTEDLSDPAERRLVAQQLKDMLAMMVSAAPEVASHAAGMGVAAARLHTLRADIDAHLGNSNLGLEWLAARQKVSPRQLQRLLAAHGTSFGDLLRQRRVARARAMIEDPQNRSSTILSIALACGFSEASAMNRAFRREFGLRPRDLR